MKKITLLFLGGISKYLPGLILLGVIHLLLESGGGVGGIVLVCIFVWLFKLFPNWGVFVRGLLQKGCAWLLKLCIVWDWIDGG